MRRYFIAACIATVGVAAVPVTTHAAIRINEIAWMGTSKSATAEWIELANTSSTTISLSGWTLIAADGSPHILFPSSAHIDAHGYFLLERTRDSTVPGIPADLIYKGGLANSGETLTLTNAASTTVDTVVSGKKWCLVGGNNTTKETAQHTSTGWITATSTPRAANATVGTVPPCAATQSKGGTGGAGTSTSATATSTQSAAATTTSHDGPPSFEPIPVVFLNIGPDRAIVAGADIKFSALVFDKKGNRYGDARVHWAFGDGSSAESTNVFKSYRAPGTYLVTATAVEGLGSGEDNMTMTVRRALVHITTVSPIGISLRNDSPYRLDLSFWKLHAATTTFSFPQGTKMLPYTTVLFPYEITKLPYTPTTTTLLYPNGKIVTQYGARGAARLAALRTTPPTQLRTAKVGCNTVQGTCPATHTGAVSANFTANENTTVIAPAASAKAAPAGALVGTTSVGAVATLPTNAIKNTMSIKNNSFFISPLHFILIGIALASSVAFVAL